MQAIAALCTTQGQLAFLYKLKDDMKLSLDSDGKNIAMLLLLLKFLITAACCVAHCHVHCDAGDIGNR